MIEKLMLRFGYLPVAEMTAAVNMVAADNAVDRLALAAERDEAVALLEAERVLRAGDVRVVGALMDELKGAKS